MDYELAKIEEGREMKASLTADPPNGFVWIADDMRTGELPDFPTESQLAATSSCIAVGCCWDVDGETTFTLGAASELDLTDEPAFDQVIEPPNCKVVVWTIELKKLLEMKVPTAHTRVRIWRNRPRFPDEIAIGVGER
jgi:hypothetical protein